MDPIIEICDASFEYPAEEGCSTRVFEHLNFSVERGSFTAVSQISMIGSMRKQSF